MSSRPVRSYRRRKPNLNLDLNHDPPLEENVREAQLGQSSVQPQELTPEPEQPQPQVPTIDVDAIEDDDVIECSPQSFALARNIARIVRRRRRRAMVDILSEEQNGENRSRTDPPNQTIIILEGSSSSLSENARKSPEPEPEPPREPVFNCPICMSQLTEEMSTRCGHIFCKKCIRTAISIQGKKCPTCRKRVTLRELRRVFLPATS